MTKSLAHFTPKEINSVLGCYDIGKLRCIESFQGGSSKNPKLLITTDQGKYLLKRRADTQRDRLSMAHTIQRRLAHKAFPVSILVKDREQSGSIVSLGEQLYELFVYMDGTRYNGSKPQTLTTGKSLAQLHQSLLSLKLTKKTTSTSFHNSKVVRSHLHTIGANQPGQQKQLFQEAARDLAVQYNQASSHVNELGFDTWPYQAIHGDYHPGNLLFSGDVLQAVIDFDSVRIASPMIDLANGLLQFSILAGHPDPAHWPDGFDTTRLRHVMQGYCQVSKPNQAQLESVPDLMIETMIAEAVLPIAATGSFGQFCGLAFMKMIQRKARWLNEKHNALTKLFKAAARDATASAVPTEIKTAI
jgi:Ser/Thr protein kinase RdoA (MazF antagonist)